MRYFNPEYRLLLTGTPWTNNAEDIYYQYKLLFEGTGEKFPLGDTITEFRRRFLSPYISPIKINGKNGQTKNKIEYELQQGAVEVMATFLAPFTDVVTLEDIKRSLPNNEVVGVKEPIVTNVDLELPKHLKRHYDIIKHSEVITINNELDTNIPDDDDSALMFHMGNGSRGAKLRQFLSGFVYYDYEDMVSNGMEITASKASSYGLCKEAHTLQPILDIKLHALRKVIEERPNENMMVLFHFSAERDLLMKHFPHAVLLNSASVDEVVPRWNNKEIRLMLANPASISHGLNLQYGGKTWVWYTPTYSLEKKLQADGRIPRPGQTHQTEMIQFRFKGTVEDAVYDSLRDNMASLDNWTQIMAEKTAIWKNKLAPTKAIDGYGGFSTR